MKRTLICASIVSVLAAVASAQPAITWQSPLAISTDTDVSTLGTQLFGWAPFNGSPQNVNGVSFSSSPPNFSPSAGFDQSYNAYPPSPSGTSAYNSDLAFGTYTVNGTIAFSWNTMTSGHTYQIQLWDSTGNGSRIDRLSGNGDTGVNIAETVSGGSGYYVIGTFVADGAGSETLTETQVAGEGLYPNFNLLQVRDITTVPEPSTLAFLAMGTGALLLGFRRKNRTV